MKKSIPILFVLMIIAMLSIGCMKNGKLTLDPTQLLTEVATDTLGNIKHTSEIKRKLFDQTQKCYKKANRLDTRQEQSKARKACHAEYNAKVEALEANSTSGFVYVDDGDYADSGDADKLKHCKERANATSKTADQRIERMNICVSNYE